MLDGGIPNYNVYLTQGQQITLTDSDRWSRGSFANLCRTLGREDLIPHEFNPEKRDEIGKFFTDTFKDQDRDEWFEILSKTDIAQVGCSRSTKCRTIRRCSRAT